MPKTVTIVEFSELLDMAVVLGYDWNQATDFLYKVRPSLEEESTEHRKSDIGQYGYPDEAIHVLTAFFEEHKLDRFTLID